MIPFRAPLLAAALGIQAGTYSIPLTNPSMEDSGGSTTGWTNVLFGGAPSLGTGVGHTGTHYLIAAPSSSSACWYQLVTVNPLFYDVIDSKFVTAIAKGWHNTFASDTDSGALILHALAADGTTLLADTLNILADDPAGFVTQQSLSLRLPAGTRYIRIGTNNARASGTELSSYWDDFTLDFVVSSTPHPTAPSKLRGWAWYVASTGSSRTVALPANAQAGDTLFVFTGASFATNLISGFTDHGVNLTGTNWNGRVQSKVLTAGDITTGTVTVTFAGSHGNSILLVATNGAATVRSIAATRASSTARSHDVTTDANPQVGDIAIEFSSQRGAAVALNDVQNTIPLLPVTGVANAIMKGHVETLTAAGATTRTFIYDGFGSGNYQAILVLVP